MAENIDGLKSALQKEREVNRRVKALALTDDDIAALKAGADLHAEFKALLRQRDALAARDIAAMAAERDATQKQADRDAGALMFATEIMALGGTGTAVDLVTRHYADRIRIDPSNRSKVTVLTETGQPSLPGCTVRDLALAAKARFPTLFR